MLKKVVPFLVVNAILVVTHPKAAIAEDENEPPESNEAVQHETESPQVSKEEVDELKQKIEALEAGHKEEMAKLREELDSKLTAQREELDLSLLESMGTEEDFAEKRLSIYGFFDFTFGRTWVDNKSIIDGLAWQYSSFMMQNINLYFVSKITETLDALLELRFTFLPLGHETSLEVAGAAEYERVDTLVYTIEPRRDVRLGGIGIERIHLTWRPSDYIGLLVGYFLTPYGIWNVDHGSPLLITVNWPYVQFAQIVPQNQLGIQIFGRAIPTRRVYFDYALTVSNGRGPMDTIHDLDENKAIGLKLKITYESRHHTAALGGYGYIGQYTDAKKIIKSFDPFSAVQKRTEQYTEYIGSLDMLLMFYGFRIQAEYARRLAVYTKRPPREMEHGIGFQPDFIHHAVYGLISYELPFAEKMKGLIITPYAMMEYSNSDNTIPGFESTTITFGLNLKPSPYIVLKAEGIHLQSLETDKLSVWMAEAQIAVSF